MRDVFVVFTSKVSPSNVFQKKRVLNSNVQRQVVTVPGPLYALPENSMMFAMKL